MSEVWDGRKMEICRERVILANTDDIIVIRETRQEVINTTSKLLKASKTSNLAFVSFLDNEFNKKKI